MSWFSDRMGDITRGNFNQTPSWSPWGQRSIDWNPQKSALATGAGLPWSAGNTNKPEDYLNLTGLGLVGKMTTPGALLDPNTYKSAAGMNLDYGGEGRAQEESAQKQKKINDEAQAEIDFKNQQAEADKKAAASDAANSFLSKQNSLEQTMMDEYRNRKKIGKSLY